MLAEVFCTRKQLDELRCTPGIVVEEEERFSKQRYKVLLAIEPRAVVYFKSLGLL